MSREPTVSIIIPAYNVAPYIGETLCSVLAQTFTDYEAIVVNDGSTDETELAIEPFRSRIVYLKQENRGLSGARNTGIRSARGRYLALLDGDDIWLPDYLAKLIGMLEADLQLDLVFPNAVLFGAPRWEGQLFQNIYPPSAPITFARLLNRECCVFVSVVFKRALVGEVGMFDESLRSAEDFDLWLRLAQRGCRFGFTTEPLVRYRKRPDSLSSDGLAMFRSLIAVYEKSRASLPDQASERSLIEEKLRELRAQENFTLSKRLLRAKDYAGARRHLTLANEHFRSRKLSWVLAALRIAPGFLRRLAVKLNSSTS
jgi:glycosyltransferase involved in cell wall biosynthesis